MGYIKAVEPTPPTGPREHECITPKPDPGRGSIWQCDECSRRFIFQPWWLNPFMGIALLPFYTFAWMLDEGRTWWSLKFYRRVRFSFWSLTIVLASGFILAALT
jgi:hypothetical protein